VAVEESAYPRLVVDVGEDINDGERLHIQVHLVGREDVETEKRLMLNFSFSMGKERA